MLKRICQSKKLAALKTDGARLLYTWLLPNVDINGCFSGDEDVIRGQIFTRLKKSSKTINLYLEDMVSVGLIVWYKANGDQFLQIPDFADKQPSLNPNKEAESTIPPPTPEQLQTYSRPTPPKVKGSKGKESKEEVKSKYLEFVFLTSEEYKKLFIKYGENPTGKLIANLNRYLGQSGKKYKSHYYTLLGFAKRDGIPELNTPKEDVDAEQQALEKKRQEMRDEYGQYYREQTKEKLEELHKIHITHRWLIDEILEERNDAQ